MSIEECVILETNSLVNYIKESDEKMLNAVRMEGILDEIEVCGVGQVCVKRRKAS